jgi:hypothetical protein
LQELSQQLLPCIHDKETYIVQTKYSLFTGNDATSPIGWYALDVNEAGEVVDDWLCFD